MLFRFFGCGFLFIIIEIFGITHNFYGFFHVFYRQTNRFFGCCVAKMFGNTGFDVFDNFFVTFFSGENKLYFFKPDF